MNYIDAYKKIERVLGEYYFATNKEYDNLGSMLGDLCTSIWIPPEGTPLMSGDPAVFSEMWMEAWDKIVGEESDGTPEQVFLAAKELLDYYKNEVLYDLGDAENYLKSALSNIERMAM